ncbi:MAG TPA: universal stress protein [Thermodesulfobacteriota bacterium]
MIHKILWATDGSKDASEALKYVEILALKYKAGVIGLSVVPDYYGVIEGFPIEEKNRFVKWMEGSVKEKEKKRLEGIEKDFSEKGLSFKKELVNGIPYKEILRVATEKKVNLIALGKGRATEKSILGGTALKVLRRSNIPVLTAREDSGRSGMKRILVPTDQSRGLYRDFKYAIELSKLFGARIYILNVVETGEQMFPPEIVEQMKGFCFRELKENIGKVKIGENIDVSVEASKNAWSGIVKFVESRDIDLIVMMTYGGGKFRDEFIGSVTQKVIQEAPCAVLTITPYS